MHPAYSKGAHRKATGYYSQDRQGLLRPRALAMARWPWTDVIPYGTKQRILPPPMAEFVWLRSNTDTGIAVQRREILVDLFYETYAGA